MSRRGDRITERDIARLKEHTAAVELAAAELADLRAVGDQLQSAASRMAEYIGSLPLKEWPKTSLDAALYEVRMAHHEALDAVDRWTEIRRKAVKS